MKPTQDEAFLQNAYALFDEFREATEGYRAKCRDNEAFWRTNHWHDTPPREAGEPQPVTPTMFSTLESVLADLMDHYPDAVLLGEEPRDDKTAECLTQLVRFVLKRRNFRRVYRKKCRAALMKGASVLEVFWDNALLGGLGDVSIRDWPIDLFFWDPKFENIQEGRACFKAAYFPRAWFEQRYPAQAAAIQSERARLLQREKPYLADDRAEDALLIEYWFKDCDPATGRERVHLCKLAGGVLLEDSRTGSPEGMYAHGQYPFVVEPLYPLEGQPVGLGLIDVLRNLQVYADKLDQIILKNALMSGKLKLLINRSADVDERALTDMDQEVVRASRIDEGAMRWMQAEPLSSHILSYQQMKLQAIKEESGQNLFNRGETGGGITAASAIVALQEAGSKRSRVLIDQLFDGYEQMVRLMVSIIQENYTEKRVFRIHGEGATQMAYGGQNEAIDFDVSIQVQKQTPYSKLYQNELAMELLKAGVIRPSDALEMMSFEGRERILVRVLQREAAEAGAAQAQG